MPTKLKPSGVKLEKKEGAWTTCGGVNDAIIIIMNLRNIMMSWAESILESRSAVSERKVS